MVYDNEAYETNYTADWNDRRRLIKMNVRFGVELPATPSAWVQASPSEQQYDAILTVYRLRSLSHVCTKAGVYCINTN